MPNKKIVYVPVTPGGTALISFKSKDRATAIKKLLKDAAHMPYDNWEGFKERGYTIEEWEET